MARHPYSPPSRPRIYIAEWEVREKLAEFATTPEEWLSVLDKVRAARAAAVIDDPLSAAGLFGWIFGNRHVRGLLKPKGWVNHREDNVEAVRDPKTGRRIVYQNADIAGDPASAPQALSGKKDGARRQIDEAQGDLFGDVTKHDAPADHPLIWYFFASVTALGDDVYVGAELSLPKPFEGDNFVQFYERIIIRRPTKWEGGGIKEPPMDDVVHVEPTIARKK
jgi:hypothetical protein